MFKENPKSLLKEKLEAVNNEQSSVEHLSDLHVKQRNEKHSKIYTSQRPFSKLNQTKLLMCHCSQNKT